jgi:hypothetical protein
MARESILVVGKTRNRKIMTNNKQQTEIDVAELAMKLYPFSNSERNAFITGYNKAKEMHKKEMVMFVLNVMGKYRNGDVLAEVAEQYYNETYGGGEQ